MRASGYERAANDWYVEPVWIVHALLRVENFCGTTADPACGCGTIPFVCANHGITCRGSDRALRGFGDQRDFLSEPMPPQSVDNIISNPPYGIIEPFLIQALKVANHKVAFLARLAFLEGIKRREMFRATPLARVWVSSRRASMPPGGSGIPAKGGSIAFAWFVWDHAHKGAPTLGWLP